MRTRFQEQLDLLNTRLIELGVLCEQAIARSMKALLTGDKTLVVDAKKNDKEINQLQRDIEALCMKILIQQQPVAGDLRFISSALKMITDMERIGDQAADIAEIVLKADDDLSGFNNHHISTMAEGVIKMVTESVDAFVKHDIQLAKVVIKYDDVIDELFTKIKRDLIQLIANDTIQGDKALDLLMIAKYLERIGDHAENTAESVLYSIRGNKRTGKK
jgi:phosphate transport system regulatory protein PhoU